MFHALFYNRARQAAVAQVLDKAWIADRETAELGPGHPGFTQEAFDPAYQHLGLRRLVF
jgi:hypothetical protein